MYILGVNSNIHDSAACLLKDGKIIAIAEQERFDRIKHSDAFPVQAIDYCLSQASITLDEIETVVFPFNSWIAVPQVIKYFFKYFPRTIPLALDRVKKGYFSFFYANHGMRKEMARRNRFRNFSFVYLEHHLCHAASAFFVSPFDEAAIMSIDGVGEWTTTLLAKGKENKIEKLYEIDFPHSLGLLYQAVTKFLGFRINSGEAKVMGLASYGNPDRFKNEFSDIINLKPNGRFEINSHFINYQFFGHNKMLSKRFLTVFGPPRTKDEPINEKHCDIAAALQTAVENAAVHIVMELHRLTLSPNLCIAGGVALNCVLNEQVRRRTPFDNIYVQPAANDAGGALGSTLLFYHQMNNKPRNTIMNHAYWGPEFSQIEIKNSLDNNNINYQKSDQIEEIAAKYISEGLTVGWFQGRMEIGPRALGNRSILADPRNPNMKDIINQKVKHRENFRPFAPSVIAENCGLYFDSSETSPFMLQVYSVKPEWREKLPAITHVDGTARVQTVQKNTNPLYYKLIQHFKKLTGIALVLNTSFNDNNEPIVSSPDEAIACYLKTGLDALIIGNFFTRK